MRAGPMDRRITLERFTSTQDEGSGEQVKVWGKLATVSASRRRASARESLAAAELAAEVTDIFEIRCGSAWADLDAKDRLVYEGRTYQISTVDEIDRREGLRIGATARADE